MKDYTEYMDNITPDPSLKGKILKRARSKPTAKNRSALSYAGLVATAAVLLLGMMIIPGAISNLRSPGAPAIYIENTPLAGVPALSGTPVYPGGSMAGGTPLHDPYRSFTPPGNNSHPLAPPPRPMEGPRSPVDYGHDRGQIPSGALPMDSTWWMTFTNPLTLEQFSSVFPTLDTGFTASAVYAYDGALVEVTAYMLCADTRKSVNIQVAEGSTGRQWALWPEDSMQVSYVNGVAVTTYTTGTYPFISSAANFMLDNIAYSIFVSSSQGEAQTRAEEIVGILVQGGAADLLVLAGPEIPELRNDYLTLEEARKDPVYGAYVPANLPGGMTMDIANRWICQQSNFLLMAWVGENTHLRWMITRAEEHHMSNNISARNFEHYERAQSTPAHGIDGESAATRETAGRAFAIQVIPAEDLTLELLESLAVYMGRMGSLVGDAPGWDVFSFAVMYGDVVIEISASGLTAQQMLDVLLQVQPS